MRATLGFSGSDALLFDISSLSRMRQGFSNSLPHSPTKWSSYTVVLVEEPATMAGWPLPNRQAPSQLYFGGPGQSPLAAVPSWAEGQVLRFTDEFACLAGHDRELLLLQLFHWSATAEPVPVPGDEQAAEIAFLLTSMKRQAAGAPLLRNDLLRSYLKTLLLHCTRLRQQQPGPATPFLQPGLFGRFQQLLEENYTKWKSVAEYAEQLHVTPNHLSVSVRKETGRPASDHIRHRIMLEAQRLVTHNALPLKEVAYQLGFEDVGHFSKLFKRCTGMTFSHFKLQTHAQYHLTSPDLMVA